MSRAALGLKVRELAEASGVNFNTISRIERGADARVSSLDAIRRALEDAGIEFIDAADGKGPGVRLKAEG